MSQTFIRSRLSGSLRLDAPAEWARSDGLTPYVKAVAAMENRIDAIRRGDAGELVWLLQHPPLYTAGASADASDLRDPDRFPVHRVRRGGKHTYHGPGQRVAYVMLDLNRRGRDVRAFVGALEDWLIDALARLGVTGETRADRVGVWVDRDAPDDAPASARREDKVAAIGVRLRRWISFHGVALNVSPDLEHFDGITPCGVDDPRFGVTSLAALGAPATMDVVDRALRAAFEATFGPTADAEPPLP
ncbi:MAG: lipoyl(octanoyl) transferase LipB [Parvularculaceae bacterium]